MESTLGASHAKINGNERITTSIKSKRGPEPESGMLPTLNTAAKRRLNGGSIIWSDTESIKENTKDKRGKMSDERTRLAEAYKIHLKNIMRDFNNTRDYSNVSKLHEQFEVLLTMLMLADESLRPSEVDDILKQQS